MSPHTAPRTRAARSWRASGSRALVSHDLNNPLTSIKGFVPLLRRDVRRWRDRGGEAPVDALLDRAAKIEDAADRMIRLIATQLAATRAAAGRTPTLDRGSVDLVDLARRTVDAYALVSPIHQARLEAEAAGLTGCWDAARLERALENLLSNAIKYSPAGGEIAVCVRREGAWAVLEVRDPGIGIPAADLPRIFERFHRGANVVGRIPGVGLGLLGTRQTIEQHGGTIAVASREGAGSVFTIRLPLAGPPSEPPFSR